MRCWNFKHTKNKRNSYSNEIRNDSIRACFQRIDSGQPNPEISDLSKSFQNSWAGKELKKARNVRPSFKFGLKIGMILSGIDQILLRGNAPWTLKHAEEDHLSLRTKSESQQIKYPRPDGVITFDRLTNVSYSSTYHEEKSALSFNIKRSKDANFK